jgi:hypothetical protein
MFALKPRPKSAYIVATITTPNGNLFSSPEATITATDIYVDKRDLHGRLKRVAHGLLSTPRVTRPATVG